MYNTIFRFVLYLFFLNSYSQNTTSKPTIAEDENGKIITNSEEKRVFFTKLHLKKEFEKQQLSIAKANLTAVEMCTNGGFEEYEIIDNETVLKDFNSIVNFPYNSESQGTPNYIPKSNQTNQLIRCVSVPSNEIDPYIGNINGFGQNVLKVGIATNNTGFSPQTIAQGIRFKNNNETELKFYYKLVLTGAKLDEQHLDSQSYFLARILNINNETISFIKIPAKPITDCDFTTIDNTSNNFTVSYNKNWRTGTLDISSIPNLQYFKVEFITATCGPGGHFAYAYIDDICFQNSESVTINPFNTICPTSTFNICGTYTIPQRNSDTPFSVVSIVLDVFDENQNIVYSNSNPISIDSNNNTFCFALNLSNFPNITNANYNVGVTVNYELSNNNDCILNFIKTNDNDAAPGYDISFINCNYPCELITQNYSAKICDILNDNSEIQDLSQFNLNLANNTNYSFDYYNTLLGAQNQINSDKITNFTYFTLNQVSKTFYVRISFSNICFRIVTLTLELIPTPTIPINDIEPLCEGSTITLNAGNNYDSYTWSTGATSQIITITQPGNYSVVVTENHGTITCTSTKNFSVVNSNIATIQEIISADWTDDNNTITVQLTNNSQGDYEYSLNGIDFQNSNIFDNLDPGEYTVFVRDKNGCGMVSEEIYLLMYPKFFTPNDDGYNDYWKIKFSENEPNLTIKIFDRYGKFIKQFGSNSIGWDGTYLGKDVPSSDYWFVVIRENGKEYKGHFSLKR